MKAGFIQTDPIFGEKERNFEEVLTLAGDIRADLLVLPELFATGYSFVSKEEAKELAEPIDGPTAGFLKKLSLSTGAIVVAGFAEIDPEERIFNSSLIVSGNQVLGTYRKIHLFNKEKQWFTPGDRRPEVYDIRGFRLGVMICFDWIFPEVTRSLALKGMQVLAHPSNLVMAFCQTAMVTRCLENRIFAITANRVGREQRGEDDYTFTGGSQITGFGADIISKAPTGTPYISVAEFDEKTTGQKMLNPFNDLLADRRPELYF
jgi:predicted amidohydrolase